MREFTKEDLAKEEWKPMFGYEEYCEASTLGRIKVLQRTSKDKNGRKVKVKEKILVLGYYSNGYEQFSIKVDNVRHTGIVHRLIAKTFIPNPNNLPVVNHKNGIKDDNRVENLEWCTQSYNGKHAFEVLGRKSSDNKGIKNPKAILTEEEVIEIRRLHKENGKTNYELADMYNMNPPAIWKILHRYTWKHI